MQRLYELQHCSTFEWRLHKKSIPRENKGITLAMVFATLLFAAQGVQSANESSRCLQDLVPCFFACCGRITDSRASVFRSRFRQPRQQWGRGERLASESLLGPPRYFPSRPSRRNGVTGVITLGIKAEPSLLFSSCPVPASPRVMLLCLRLDSLSLCAGPCSFLLLFILF